MNADQEIIYNTMCMIVKKLSVLEESINEKQVLLDSAGMTLQEISALKKIDASSLRRKPWLLPLDPPEYGKNPVVYSRRQVIMHEKLIETEGIDTVKKMWSMKQKNKNYKIQKG